MSVKSKSPSMVLVNVGGPASVSIESVVNVMGPVKRTIALGKCVVMSAPMLIPPELVMRKLEAVTTPSNVMIPVPAERVKIPEVTPIKLIAPSLAEIERGPAETISPVKVALVNPESVVPKICVKLIVFPLPPGLLNVVPEKTKELFVTELHVIEAGVVPATKMRTGVVVKVPQSGSPEQPLGLHAFASAIVIVISPVHVMLPAASTFKDAPE